MTVKRRDSQDRDEAEARAQADSRREKLLAQLRAREAAGREPPVPAVPDASAPEPGSDDAPEPEPGEPTTDPPNPMLAARRRNALTSERLP